MDDQNDKYVVSMEKNKDLEVKPLSYTNTKARETGDVYRWIDLALGYKWWVITIVAIFAIISYVWVLSIPYTYRSSGTLIIAENKSQYSYVSGDIANLLTTSYGLGLGGRSKNELAILSSRTLAQQLAVEVMAQGVMPNGEVFPLLMAKYPNDSSLVPKAALTNRILRGISVSWASLSDLVTVSFSGFSPIESAWMVNKTIEVYTHLSTEYNRLSSRLALQFLSREKERIGKKLEAAENKIKDFIVQNRIINVRSYTQIIEKRIQDLEDQLYKNELRREIKDTTINFHKNRLKVLRPELFENLSEANRSQLQILLSLLQKEQRTRSIILATNPELSSKENSIPELRKINTHIKQYQSAIDELVGDFDSESIALIIRDDGGIPQTISHINNLIREHDLENRILKITDRTALEQIEDYTLLFKELADKVLEQKRLERDLNIQQSLYISIAKQLEETSLWDQTQVGYGRPVDYATVYFNPVGPNRKLWIAGGFGVGLIFALAMIILRELLNIKIQNIDDLRERGLPLLTVIPDMLPAIKKGILGKGELKNGNNKLPDKHQYAPELFTLHRTDSVISESYRRLQSNVMYSNPDKLVKTILVTSCKKSEGKTVTSANLAIVLAEVGKRVLLIDADFRRCYQHKIFGVPQTPGVIEILFDKSASFEEVVKNPISFLPNFSLLTTGRRPPNSSSISQSSSFSNLVRKCRESYDYVVLDTAPYGIVSDSALLLNLVDGVILTVRFNYTTRVEVDYTIDSLKQVNTPLLGIVLNSFDYNKSTGYHYSSRYYKRSYAAYGYSKDYYYSSYYR